MKQKKGTAVAHLIPAERIETKILLIRGQKVMLDEGLSELYGVETKQLTFVGTWRDFLRTLCFA